MKKFRERRLGRVLVGVDGCRGGWLALIESRSHLAARVFPDWPTLMAGVPAHALVGVDIPIGLPRAGSRRCDVEARKRLKPLRTSSVFPAPVRCCLRAAPYGELNRRHRRADGRGLTRQAYFLLPKIREVDRCIGADPARQGRIREVHPEVSFAAWNGGPAMRHRKLTAAGRAERERLIDQVWPGQRQHLWLGICARGCRPDDLNDAFAALWTVRRIAAGEAVRMPVADECDERGVRMEIVV